MAETAQELLIQCLPCKAKVAPVNPVVNSKQLSEGKVLISGKCPQCKKNVSSFKSVQNWYNKLSNEQKLALQEKQDA
jgi:hypothetical protein